MPPPMRKKRRYETNEELAAAIGMPMGPDPSQLYPDSQGRYRSLAGANPSPSMEYGKKATPAPIPPVSVTAQSLARRLAQRGGEEGSMPIRAAKPKRKRKSLIDYVMELQQ